MLSRRDQLYRKYRCTHNVRFLCEANRLTKEARSRMLIIVQTPFMSCPETEDTNLDQPVAVDYMIPEAQTELETHQKPTHDATYFVRVAPIRRSKSRKIPVPSVKKTYPLEKYPLELGTNKMFIRSEYLERLAESKDEPKRGRSVVGQLRKMLRNFKL